MSIYDDHFGVQFGLRIAGDSKEYHSFKDLSLYPRKRPVISPPTPKRLTVDVPGMNGSLDYSLALTGFMQYENREAVMEYTYIGDRSKFSAIYHNVLGKLHGKKMSVVFDEDKAGFYTGFLSVDDPEYAKDRMYLTIHGDFEPFRYDMWTSAGRWLWDPFSFVDGVIRDYSSITFTNGRSTPSFDNDGTDAVKILGSVMPVVPHIILVSGSAKLGYKSQNGNKTVTLTSGDNYTQTPDLLLRNGTNTIWLAGTGEVSVDFRGGSL